MRDLNSMKRANGARALIELLLGKNTNTPIPYKGGASLNLTKERKLKKSPKRDGCRS